MAWERLISDKRLGLERFHDPRTHTRSDFQRDYDRLVFSSPFRRLQNKTQVFPLPGSIFVHNRLTHSLEVASVGRSMAREAALLLSPHANASTAERLSHLPDIVAAACLCHDLGNPPFGHSGEKTISTYFTEGNGIRLKEMLSEREWADVANFEGNANSFRVLTHQFVGRREGGFAMTYSTLASIVKYPYTSQHAGMKGKFGFFKSEEDLFRRIAGELGIPETEPGRFARHPLVYLVEAADDICYQIMDLEDSHRLGIVSLDEVATLLLGFFEEDSAQRLRRGMSHLSDPNEQVSYLRSNVIGIMVENCARSFADHEQQLLDGSLEGSLTDHLPKRLHQSYQACSRLAWEKIYNASSVVDVEIAGNRIITYLLDTLMQAVIHPERNFSKLILEKVPKQYDIHSPEVFTRVQGVLDHVSAMTDVYALDLFRKLNGHSLPAV